MEKGSSQVEAGQPDDGEFIDWIQRASVLVQSLLQILAPLVIVAGLVVWLRGGDIRDLIGLFSLAILCRQYGTV